MIANSCDFILIIIFIWNFYRGIDKIFVKRFEVF